MSRSYRKTPIVPACGSRSSNKADKRLANRKLRSVNRQRLKVEPDSEPLLITEVSSRYEFKSEYKFHNGLYPLKDESPHWFGNRTLEKLQSNWRKLMRK